MKSADHGAVTAAPGLTVACTRVIGVYVAPGPWWPSSDPAMTRSSAPPSGVLSRPTSDARRSWYRGVAAFWARGEVDPELDAVEQPAADDERLRRLLDVQDAGTGGHPLGVAVGDRAAAAVGVGVLEGAVDDVGHRFEAAMRMPGRALRLARGVLDLAHLVHVHERVQIGQLHTGECPPDREAFTLEAVRSGGRGEGTGRDSPAVGAEAGEYAAGRSGRRR